MNTFVELQMKKHSDWDVFFCNLKILPTDRSVHFLVSHRIVTPFFYGLNALFTTHGPNNATWIKPNGFWNNSKKVLGYHVALEWFVWNVYKRHKKIDHKWDRKDFNDANFSPLKWIVLSLLPHSTKKEPFLSLCLTPTIIPRLLFK